MLLPKSRADRLEKVGKFELCASCSVSGGCVKWINIDQNHKMDIIRVDGNFGKAGGRLESRSALLPFACGDSVRPHSIRSLCVKVGRVCGGRPCVRRSSLRHGGPGTPGRSCG